jgi:hypothetical protein
MPTNITIYSNQKLEPFMNPEEAKMMDIKLGCLNQLCGRYYPGRSYCNPRHIQGLYDRCL